MKLKVYYTQPSQARPIFTPEQKFKIHYHQPSLLGIGNNPDELVVTMKVKSACVLDSFVPFRDDKTDTSEHNRCEATIKVKKFLFPRSAALKGISLYIGAHKGNFIT